MPALLGFDSPEEFARYMKTKYKPPAGSAKKNKAVSKGTPNSIEEFEEFEVFKIFYDQHLRTIEVCQNYTVPI